MRRLIRAAAPVAVRGRAWRMRCRAAGLAVMTMTAACDGDVDFYGMPPLDLEVFEQRTADVDEAPEEEARRQVEIEQPPEPALPEPLLFPGDDTFLDPAAARPAPGTEDGEIILNFENIELREFVRTVLGDILGRSYFFDPRVEGTVSLMTARPLPRDAVLPTVEMVLRQNGAALVTGAGGLLRVVPANEAVQAQAMTELAAGARPLEPGYQVLVVPLEFVSAIQMARILEPLQPPEGIIRVDPDRNVLVLAGTSRELEMLRRTIQIFDVNWLQGMSAGLFPLENVDAETFAEELEAVFGDLVEGPLAGLVRFVPIERLNALLVVTQRSEYLREAEKWIDRLDRGDAASPNLYVYYVQNGKAADLASILNELFTETRAEREEIVGRLAPGLAEVRIGAERRVDEEVEAGAAPEGEGAPPPAEGAEPAPAPRDRQTESLAFFRGSEIRIIADEVNNALLVLATPQEYRMVEAALRKLDIVPLQVLIDATIADVTLNNELRYGVQFFLESDDQTGVFSLGNSSDLAARFPGFSYSFIDQDGSPQVILDALETVTRVNVISSPRLLVLDNQTARLQVGDEVPVITQQQQSIADPDANIINNIQFRETGVILEVTPRVNAGGLVTLEIQQEVSNVSQQVDSGQLTPTIAQREISSSIAIQSGETVVLGGLIEQNDDRSRTGIPILSEIPVLGNLFSGTESQVTRTELIVLLTPRVIRNPDEARQVTDELRRRINALAPFVKSVTLDPDEDGTMKDENGEPEAAPEPAPETTPAIEP